LLEDKSDEVGWYLL